MKSLDDLREFCQHDHLDLDKFLVPILKFAIKETSSEIGVVGLVDDESQSWLRLRANHVVGSDPNQWMHGGSLILPVGGKELSMSERSLSGYVAHTQKSYRSDNVIADAFYKSIDEQVQSELVVPIVKGRKILGVISVESRTIYNYTEIHQELLETIADIMSDRLEIFLQQDQINYYFLPALK